MMRGTYSSQTEVGVPRSAAEIEADQKKTAAVQAALQKAQLGGNVKRQGTFSLNPSLNPRFDIAGEIPVARPEAGGGASIFPTLFRQYIDRKGKLQFRWYSVRKR